MAMFLQCFQLYQLVVPASISASAIALKAKDTVEAAESIAQASPCVNLGRLNLSVFSDLHARPVLLFPKASAAQVYPGDTDSNMTDAASSPFLSKLQDLDAVLAQFAAALPTQQSSLPVSPLDPGGLASGMECSEIAPLQAEAAASLQELNHSETIAHAGTLAVREPTVTSKRSKCSQSPVTRASPRSRSKPPTDSTTSPTVSTKLFSENSNMTESNLSQGVLKEEKRKSKSKKSLSKVSFASVVKFPSLSSCGEPTGNAVIGCGSAVKELIHDERDSCTLWLTSEYRLA